MDNANAAVQGRAPRIGQAYYAAFVSDDFKLSKTLLINLGLRYDIDKPRTEAHGNCLEFQPYAAQCCRRGAAGALYFAGTGAGRIGGSGEFCQDVPQRFLRRASASRGRLISTGQDVDPRRIWSVLRPA